MMKHYDHFLAAISFEEQRKKKKKTTEHVQVLFLLGFGKICWGANNKTQTVHRLGFDKSTVSISPKG